MTLLHISSLRVCWIREKMEAYDPDVVVSVHPTMNYVPLFSIRKISEKVGRGELLEFLLCLLVRLHALISFLFV